MRVLFAIAALFVLADAHHGGPHNKVVPDLFGGNKEYVYNYRSLVATGLPLETTQFAGLEKYGLLTVQVQQEGSGKNIGLHLGQVKSGAFDKEIEDITLPIENIPHMTEETIEKYGPVFVKIVENEVQEIKTPPGMPEEVINVYRGIAALFTVGNPTEGEHTPFTRTQVYGDETPVVYRRFEEGLTGNCETTYEVLSEPTQGDYLNLTKTRNYMNCLGRDPRFLHDQHETRGCPGVCPTHKPEQIEGNMEPEMSDWESPITEGCPVDFHPKNDLVEAFTTYNYNMTVGGDIGIIHGAQAIDKKVLPVRRQQIKTVSVLQLRLLKEGQVTDHWETGRATKQYHDLAYRFPEEHNIKPEALYLSHFGKVDRRELKQQIVPMINSLASIIANDDIEVKGRTGDKIIQLTMAIGLLEKNDIGELWGILGNLGTNPGEKEYVQRKVLLDVIGLAGTNEAAEFLLELIKGQKLNPLETVHTLQTMNNLLRPNKKVMDNLLELCTGEQYRGQRHVFSTACLALADVVEFTCSKHGTTGPTEHRPEWAEQYKCGEQQFKKYIQEIVRHLDGAKDFAEQAVYLQTLGKFSHHDAIKAMIPYIHGEHEVASKIQQINRHDDREDHSEYLQFLRQIAIYSLHHATKDHGPTIQPIVQGIYHNREESYEVRIAALSILLRTQPTEATFGRIVMELGNEEDLEVASYAFSSLRTLANATLPCMEQTARRVRNVLAALPHRHYGMHHSKAYGFTKYEPRTNFGLKGDFELVYSNVSAIPRAGYGSLTANKGPFVSTVGEYGFLVKGFENLDKFILQKGGLKKIIEDTMNRVRRTARSISREQSVEKMLDELEQGIKFNPDENSEEPRAVFSTNVLGNNLYLPVDKEYMSKIAKKAGEEFFKFVRSETPKTYRYVHILQPRTYIQVTPGVNGLPIVLTNRHPIVVSVALKDIKTRFGTEETRFSPFTFAVTGMVQPTVYHTSVHSALTINPFTQERMAYGVRTTEQTHLTLPVDATIQYTHHTKTFGLTLRPRIGKVFYHKTTAITFKTTALVIRSAEQSLFDRATSVKTQVRPFQFDRVYGKASGMQLRIEGSSLNEEYALNFLRDHVSRDKGVLSSLLKEIRNEWMVPREWSLRMEQNEEMPITEIKLIARIDNLLRQRLHEEHGQQKMHHEIKSEEIEKDKQIHGEELRMLSYDHEYKQLSGGRQPENLLEPALQRMVQKTQKYWNEVNPQLSQLLNKKATQARGIEYIISAKGQKQPTIIMGHMVLASTLDKQAKLVEMKMDVKESPIYVEAQAVAAFTPAPQPFLSKVEEKQQRAIIGVVVELETEQTGKQHYEAKVQMRKSREQLELAEEQKHKQPWFVQQCEEDMKDKKQELTSACTISRYHKSALNELDFEITLPQKNHDKLVNATHKLREALKVRLYRNLRANYLGQGGEENKIKGWLKFSEKADHVRMANLTIITPDHEELHFERLSLPLALRPNTMWSIKEQLKAFVKLDRPEPECIYNGENLRTFDNVTISLDVMKPGQKYVLARDNDEEPKYIVIAEPKGEQTTIEILLRNVTYLKLTPPTQKNDATYNVHMNSTQVPVTRQHYEVRQYGKQTKNIVTFHVHNHKEGQDTLVIRVRDQRIQFVYDGKNFKIVMAQLRSRGQVTGLCGDNNNQHLEELTGPQGCIYESERDFVRSFSLQQEPIEGEWKCPQGIHPRHAQQHQIQRYSEKQRALHGMHHMYQSQRQQQRQDIREHMNLETHIMSHQQKVCFSVEPVKACKPGSRQVESEQIRVAYICLNRNDRVAQDIQRDIQINKITNLLPPVRGAIYKQIEVPKRCQQ